MIFARETCAQVSSDIIPLTLLHHKEISKYQDIELQPDFPRFFTFEAMGALRIYTVRTNERELIGYQFFFINRHPHYESVTASQDLLFIHPRRRGFGLAFIRWCEEQLKEEGIGIVYAMVTTRFDYSILLKRMGYEPTETIYSKRLNKD